MKDKQGFTQWRGGMRVGKGVPDRKYSSCKGSELEKSTENAGASKRTGAAAEIKGKCTTEGSGKMGRGRTLQSSVEHRPTSVSLLRAA